MFDRTRRTTLFVAYQLTIMLGILTMPIALALRRVGLTIPLHKVVESIERAYETC